MQECASSCREDVEVYGGRDENLDGVLAPESESRDGLSGEELKSSYGVTRSFGASVLRNKL